MKTKWWSYSQNNSGGSFHHDADAGIGTHVFIEAVDVVHANARAENIGLYFNGCDTGQDCSCCGDRWYRAYRDEGTDAPESYEGKFRAAGKGEAPYTYWDLPSYMHPLEGKFSSVVLMEKDD